MAGLSLGFDGSTGGSAGAEAAASGAGLSLDDIERNELALKAEVFSKIDRAGAEEASAAGKPPKTSGITIDDLLIQLRSLGHEVTREFVTDIFSEITKNSGQQTIELPDFLKFLDDPAYAAEPDDDTHGTNTAAAAAAGATTGGSAGSSDTKYPAASPKAGEGKSTTSPRGSAAGDGKGPDAAAIAEARKKELVERKLNAPMTADALDLAYRLLQSAHPNADGLTVSDFDAAFRITRESADSHRGVLSSLKAPTTQELQDLMKQIDPYSPDVTLRDALARWVLINDHVTVAQPLFLTQPAGVPPGGLPTPQMMSQMSTSSLTGAGGMAGMQTMQMGMTMNPMMMSANGMVVGGARPSIMPVGASGGPPLIKQMSSSGSATSLHPGGGVRKSVMMGMV